MSDTTDRPANPELGPMTSTVTKRLRRDNVIAGLFHLIQAIVVLVLATSFALPVTASFLAGPPGTPPQSPTTLFSANIAILVAAFLLLSSLAHAIMASPRVFQWYVGNLARQRNYGRWIEYSISSSLMIVLIAMITGISDIAALLALFGVNVSMILFGLLQEHYETPGNGRWLPFIFGCVAGIVPWLAIGIYLVSPGSASNPPGFVYGIFFSLFAFFNIFALNQWLQYKPVGKWANYIHGERVYILLSLVAKSLLAWQIFAATLAPS